MIKKHIYWQLYIFENSRKIAIFFGYREKKKRMEEGFCGDISLWRDIYARAIPMLYL